MFPEKSKDDSSNFYHELQRKTSLICKQIYKGKTKERAAAIKQIQDWELTLITPKNFDSNDVENYISKIELSFENLCASLEDLGVRDPGNLTIFQFYSRLSYFDKKKLRQQQQAQNRRR